MTDPGSYAEAVPAAQALLRKARLADPGEHFPYRREAAQDAIDDDAPLTVWAWDPRRGLAPTLASTAEVLTEALADATGAFIAAQEAYLRDPGTEAAYRDAQDALVAARRAHREHRGDRHGIIADEARP